MDHEQALEKCKAEVSRLGYRVSSGCWSEDDRAYAFSVESCGPETFGHPKCEIIAKDYGDGQGWRFFRCNDPITITGGD